METKENSQNQFSDCEDPSLEKLISLEMERISKEISSLEIPTEFLSIVNDNLGDLLLEL